MEWSRYLAELLGRARCYLKCENLQRTGSYKIRGAYNRSRAERRRERRARSRRGLRRQPRAGRRVRGARARHPRHHLHAARRRPAQASGDPRTTAPRSCCAGDVVDETLQAAAEFATRTGAVLIPPFDHPDIVAGQGTLGARDPRAGARIVDDHHRADRRRRPRRRGRERSQAARRASWAARMRVIGVQAENAAAYSPSLAAGDPSAGARRADDRRRHRGRAGRASSTSTSSATPSTRSSRSRDDDTARALARAARAREARGRAGGRGRGRGDPGGRDAGRRPDRRGALAAATSTRWSWSGSSAHGLAASERYLTISIPLPDRPGQLARIAETHRRGQRERRRGAAHPARRRAADQRGRDRASHGDPRARARERSSRCCGMPATTPRSRSTSGIHPGDDAARCAGAVGREPVSDYWPAQVSTPVTSTGISGRSGAV